MFGRAVLVLSKRSFTLLRKTELPFRYCCHGFWLRSVAFVHPFCGCNKSLAYGNTYRELLHPPGFLIFTCSLPANSKSMLFLWRSLYFLVASLQGAPPATTGRLWHRKLIYYDAGTIPLHICMPRIVSHIEVVINALHFFKNSPRRRYGAVSGA